MKYVLNISIAVKKMKIKEVKKYLFQKYYRRIGFPRKKGYYSMKHQQKNELLLLATKLIEKILNAFNTKQYHQSYLKRKNTKLEKQSKIVTQQSKTFENANIVDLNSGTIYRTF